MSDLLDRIRALFPIAGVELVDLDAAFVARLRIGTREQAVELLPAEHRYQRGLDFLEASAAVIRELPADELASAMPADLFLFEILEIRGRIDRELVARVWGDARARRIIAVNRGDDPPIGWSLAELAPTMDPARFTPPPCLSDPALEAAIFDDPDDRDAHAIYADWLSDRGDPRGELIALQMMLTGSGKDSSEVIAADSKLRREHAYAWLGELAWTHHDALWLDWHFGWLRRALLRERELSIAAFLGCTSARFIRALDVAKADGDAVETLCATTLPRSLRTLALRADTRDRFDVSPLYPKLAMLTELVVQAPNLELGTIVLPELRTFVARSSDLTLENHAAIRGAHWPRLEALGIGVARVDDMRWILDGEVPDGVTHLALHDGDDDALLAALADAPILERLESLDISTGRLTDVGASVLDRPAFRRLATITIPQFSGVVLLDNVVWGDDD